MGGKSGYITSTRNIVEATNLEYNELLRYAHLRSKIQDHRFKEINL